MSLLKPLTNKTKKIIESDPFYKQCARIEEGNCSGRITLDHSLYFAGKRLDDWWSLVPVCEFHHSVNKFQDSGDLNKEKHQWIALNRAPLEDLKKYDRANFIEKRNLLNRKFGEYKKFEKYIKK